MAVLLPRTEEALFFFNFQFNCATSPGKIHSTSVIYPSKFPGYLFFFFFHFPKLHEFHSDYGVCFHFFRTQCWRCAIVHTRRTGRQIYSAHMGAGLHHLVSSFIQIHAAVRVHHFASWISVLFGRAVYCGVCWRVSVWPNGNSFPIANVASIFMTPK